MDRAHLQRTYIGTDIPSSQYKATLHELHIDRAYLSSRLVRERSEDLHVYCKAWPVRNGNRFLKTAFELDWERRLLRCPAKQEMPFVPGLSLTRALYHQSPWAQCQHSP